MKRDMELVRSLLLKIEEAEAPVQFIDLLPQADDAESDRIAYHIRMLVEEAGYVRGVDGSTSNGDDWMDLQLTWAGHEVLGNLRDPTVWERTKSGAAKMGGVGIDILLGIAKEYAKAEIKNRLGLNL